MQINPDEGNINLLHKLQDEVSIVSIHADQSRQGGDNRLFDLKGFEVSIVSIHADQSRQALSWFELSVAIDKFQSSYQFMQINPDIVEEEESV